MSDELAKGELTGLLKAWGRGGPDEDRLFLVLQPKLVRHAGVLLNRNRDLVGKIDKEELVNEVYLRLRKSYDKRGGTNFAGRGKFFALVIGSMRHVLCDIVNKGGADGREKDLMIPLDRHDVAVEQHRSATLLDLDRALEELGEVSEDLAVALKFHYYGGLTLEESAEAMDMSTATFNRRLRDGRDWVEERLTAPPPGGPPRA